jgi:hypothetical protein
MFTKLRTRLLNGLTSRNVPTNKWHFRPTVESLEDRTLLATRFLLTGYPALATAGVSQNVTVTAQNSDGSTDTSYWGFFHFHSTDTWAVLPATSYLTNGIGTFHVTLQTAGTQSITVTDTVNATITGSETGISVKAAATSRFQVSGWASATAGVAGNVTVTAMDSFGNPTPGYAGTVHFSSSDLKAVLPADTALTKGKGTFSVALKTAGKQTLTVTDISNSGIAGSLAAIPQTVPVYTTSPQPERRLRQVVVVPAGWSGRGSIRLGQLRSGL